MSFLQAAGASEPLKVMAAKRVTYFSFDLLPRISRAQCMDALVLAGHGVGLPGRR